MDPSIEVEHLLIMEVVGDVPLRYYLAKLPVINSDIRKRLRLYENPMDPPPSGLLIAMMLFAPLVVAMFSLRLPEVAARALLAQQ